MFIATSENEYINMAKVTRVVADAKFEHNEHKRNDFISVVPFVEFYFLSNYDGYGNGEEIKTTLEMDALDFTKEEQEVIMDADSEKRKEMLDNRFDEAFNIAREAAERLIMKFNNAIVNKIQIEGNTMSGTEKYCGECRYSTLERGIYTCTLHNKPIRDDDIACGLYDSSMVMDNEVGK